MGPAAQRRVMLLRERFISRRSLKLSDTAAHFECSRDTIKRDIEILRNDLRMMIEYDPATRCWVYTPAEETPALTSEEFVALSLSAQLLRRIAGTRFERSLRAALEKVGRSLPPALTVDAEQSAGRTHSFALDLLRGEQELVAKNLTLLSDAIDCKHRVRTEYFTFSSGELKERFLDPYHLLFHGDAWYCIAYCHLRNEVRTFAVQRMHRLIRTPAQWRPQPGFDLDEYMNSAFGLETGEPEDLAVTFGPAAARYVQERKWHHTQQIEELEDGSIVFRARVACGSEVRRWVLQYGAEAEVLSPARLRNEVAAEVAGMASRYK